MSFKTSGSVFPPGLSSVLEQKRAEIFTDLNCHQVGRIVSFDAPTQTASIQLSMTRSYGDKVFQYPVLVNCPVFVPAGSNGRLSFPVAPGDFCLVLFNDRNIDTWSTTGATDVPPTPRCHSLADGIAIIGVRPASNPLPNYNTEDAELSNNVGKILVGAKIAIRNDSQNLKAVLDLVITALTTLDSVKTGGSAAIQITAALIAIGQLLKP